MGLLATGNSCGGIWAEGLAEAGGGRAASELLTTWMQYPNVPYFQQKAEASYWDRNMSMASAHWHISASTMSPSSTHP